MALIECYHCYHCWSWTTNLFIGGSQNALVNFCGTWFSWFMCHKFCVIVNSDIVQSLNLIELIHSSRTALGIYCENKSCEGIISSCVCFLRDLRTERNHFYWWNSHFFTVVGYSQPHLKSTIGYLSLIPMTIADIITEMITDTCFILSTGRNNDQGKRDLWMTNLIIYFFMEEWIWNCHSHH
jgi:hypothetical protein